MPTWVQRMNRAVDALCKDIEAHVPPDVARQHHQQLSAVLGLVIQNFRDNPAFQEEETTAEPKPHTPAPTVRQVTH
jgi:hypothetical protein